MRIFQELQLIYESKIYLQEVTKSIHSQTNNRSPMVSQPIYIYFSTELSTILLDVHDPLEKLVTSMGATSSPEIISRIYKFIL